jgi:hypothetical protein
MNASKPSRTNPVLCDGITFSVLKPENLSPSFTSTESLRGVPLVAGLGTADHGSTSPYVPGLGVDEASGSNVGARVPDEGTNAEEARLEPPMRRGALNMMANAGLPKGVMRTAEKCIDKLLVVRMRQMSRWMVRNR